MFSAGHCILDSLSVCLSSVCWLPSLRLCLSTELFASPGAGTGGQELGVVVCAKLPRAGLMFQE